MQAYQSRQAQTRAQEMGIETQVSNDLPGREVYESIREKLEDRKRESEEKTIGRYGGFMRRVLRVTDRVGFSNPQSRLNTLVQRYEAEIRQCSDLESFYDRELDKCFEKANNLTAEKHEIGDKALAYDDFIRSCQQDRDELARQYQETENRLESGTVPYQERAKIKREMDLKKNNMRELDTDIDNSMREQSEIASKYIQVETRERVNEGYMLEVQVVKGQLTDHKTRLEEEVGVLRTYAEQEGTNISFEKALNMIMGLGESAAEAQDMNSDLSGAYNKGIEALSDLPSSVAQRRDDYAVSTEKLKGIRDKRREAIMDRIRQSIHGGKAEDYTPSLTPAPISDPDAPVVTESEGEEDPVFTEPVNGGNGRDHNPPSDFSRPS